MDTEQTPERDLSSLRSLITSVTPLARHLKMTNEAIYRWIEVNRIPHRHIVKVANFYDVEIRDLLPFTGSDKGHKVVVHLKSREVLKTLIDVYKGAITLQQACTITNSSRISLTLILSHWGDELPTLFSTLEQLDQRRIDLDEACRRLNVTKYTMHGIRRKYGYAPGRLKKTKPPPTLPQRRLTTKEAALDCIAGRMTAREAAYRYKISERTIFRCIETLSPVKLNDLSAWPKVFREAFSVELTREMPKYVQKWLDFAKKEWLYLEKSPKYPEPPIDWRKQPLKRLLIAVLLGEHSLDEIAHLKGGDPQILEGLFSGDLHPIGLTFEEASALPILHQAALAELIMAVLNRKRRFVE